MPIASDENARKIISILLILEILDITRQCFPLNGSKLALGLDDLSLATILYRA
jgi:hypothetical protein